MTLLQLEPCSLITAREEKNNFKSNHEGIQNNRFKIYCSKEAHSSVEKAVRAIGIGSNNLKKISTNSNLSMNFIELEEKIKKDLKNNFTPLAIISTFGTTGTVTFDSLKDIGKIAKKYKIWHPINAANCNFIFKKV